MKSHRPLRRFGAIVAAVGATAALAAVPAASADATADYNTALSLGTQAYEYGVPLLDMQRVFSTSTSVTVSDGDGHGPVNQFSNIRTLATAAETTVNAPNNDTPYSIAWLDLSKQPMVLHAPAIKGRFWEFELLDPWTNNFYNMTSATYPMGPGSWGVTGGGNWALVGPAFKGKLPKGVKRVKSLYNRVWVIGRTFVRGQADLVNVHKIQNQYSVTPLSKFGTNWKPAKPERVVKTPTMATIPGTQPGQDPIQFFVALDKEMKLFPPPARDKPLLTQLKPLGIGPGLNPLTAGLSAATLSGLRAAVTGGPATVQTAAVQVYLQSFSTYNGYFVHDLGNWGTDYMLRAVGDKIGLGGQRASIATYPFALLDDTKGALNGSNRYVLHIPASSLPIPVHAFWSLTMYNSQSFFVPNSLNRYLLNDLSHLHKNADGSIDIYVQSNEPTNPAQVSNWLPAPPAGQGFRLIWRLYDLGSAVNSVLNGTGWKPPQIQPCDASGVGNLGTACAS
jgi:DNA sulfur modification protein DndE